MNNKAFQDSELILNKDGSVYHIHLKPEHIAKDVILVGDMGRVEQISKHFDRVEFKIQNREFLTHTGTIQGKRITVVSTGIGTDNIDIVLNELDAAINFDLENRKLKSVRRSLNLFRIGTSGALHEDIPVGSFVISEYGLGFDGLMHYYDFKPNTQEREIGLAIQQQIQWPEKLSIPYLVSASKNLIETIGSDMIKGITATATGFYGPQGRRLYLSPSIQDLNKRLKNFAFKTHRITNFEMETSALYGLGSMLGHQCCTCCAIIANRSIHQYSENYKLIVEKLIKTVLQRIVNQS